MPPTTVMAGRRVLFAMAAEAEYGPHLRRLFEPLMTGVGPIEAAVALTAALGELEGRAERPAFVVSLGSAGSRRLQRTEVYQAVSVTYRDMDASAFGFEKGVTPMRSFVVEPMQHQRLFLAGDAAHIVPPTGAKGLNTAMADVALLASSIGDERALAAYTERALERVWRVQHFSWWMTSMLHRMSEDPFETQLQRSQLRYTVTSEAQATALAENYVGLPFITA